MSPKRSRPQNNPPATQSRSSHPIRSVAGLVFLVAVAIGAPPLMHFSRQASSGSPLDPAYFRREFSWQRFLKLGLYNGEGGEDWSIGEPLAELRSADRKQRLPELRVFALQLVNRDRAINGLPPLLPDPDLDVAAQFHAQDMYDRDYFDHVSPEGLSALDRYLSISQTLRAIGENIAYESSALSYSIDGVAVNEASDASSKTCSGAGCTATDTAPTCSRRTIRSLASVSPLGQTVGSMPCSSLAISYVGQQSRPLRFPKPQRSLPRA